MIYKYLPNSLYKWLKSAQLKLRIRLANKSDLKLVIGSGGL